MIMTVWQRAGAASRAVTLGLGRGLRGAHTGRHAQIREQIKVAMENSKALRSRARIAGTAYCSSGRRLTCAAHSIRAPSGCDLRHHEADAQPERMRMR